MLRLQTHELALYFFLVLVGDRHGLSYYSVAALSRYLKLSPDEIERARISLLHRDLIAFEPPLYQVLSLPEKAESQPMSRSDSSTSPSGEATSIGELLENILKRRAQ